MIAFLATVVRFLRTIALVARDPELRGAGLLVLALLGVGTAFYSGAEGWSPLDALYFSVVTLMTVGFGDLTPTTPIAKAFTIIYILTGVGVLLGLVDVLARQGPRGRGRRDPDG